jgi:hypothetical protein
MAKKKFPQPAVEPAEIPQPSPEAVEKFDTLIAEETRRTPAPFRTVGPFDVGQMIRDRVVLPAGASLEFKTWRLFFFLPPDTELDHDVDAVITAGDSATAAAALDAAIEAAGPRETWSYEEARFFLHAVQISDHKSKRISLKYIFRQRPSEAPAERR